VVAGVAAVVGAAVGAGSGDESDEPGPAAAAVVPQQCAGSDAQAAHRMAGQRLIVRTDAVPDRKLLVRARSGEIAGVIVFPAPGQGEPAVREGIEKLQGAAATGDEPPLIVATDQEGGGVKRFFEAPPQRSPAQLAEVGDPGDARLEGKATANFLTRLGINADLAPVLDVPASPDSAIAVRAFGDDAAQVSELGLAFADGLANGGALATAKHFPGLGRSTLNTDFSASAIEASRRELAEDLKPFEDAIAQDVPLVMVGLAGYPGLGAKEPAALSPEIAQGLLRDRLGFEGVSITDDLEAGAVAATHTAPRAAIAAAEAGNDLLLFAQDSAPGVLDALAHAIATARIDIEAARASCVRIVEMRAALPPEAG
jgi:beta-N-acetylhexosaminidase